MKEILRFRQVHLDFHTSPAIKGIGAKFKKKEFQDALKAGRVDSITVFAKCHHGLSYHPTKVGTMHPHLSFDLLRAQVEACREINVNTPIYISAGLDSVMAGAHPEWLVLRPDGRRLWANTPLDAGFRRLCYNTPYMDFLCDQIREVVALHPTCHGIFLDIISEEECCCKWCMEWMAKNGLDATLPESRKKASQHTLRRYYERATAACREQVPAMRVFHNSGHVTPGYREIFKHFSHLELESLPTGGWGYDHYPMSAKYVANLGLDFLGMTGKFHASWGEFGGLKHPNALRYECAAMLAYGSKCSIGDQCHPSGKMDASTYEVIGEAYDEVAKKEPWCAEVKNIADVGLLLSASLGTAPAGSQDRSHRDDVGANRALLEGHFLFDTLDTEADFSKYRALVISDSIRIEAQLKKKLDRYLAKGGKLFLSGQAGVAEDNTFLFDVGAKCDGLSPFSPDFILPRADLQPAFVKTPLVMYSPSRRVRVTDGVSLGDIYDPYFNRTYAHYCSHRHTPNELKPSGFACGVMKGNVMYLAHPVFTHYQGNGAVAYKDFIVNSLRLLLGQPTLGVKNLPSTARVTLMEQPAQKRFIAHLLYANTILRGANGSPTGAVEVIEDLVPLHDIEVTVRLPRKVKNARLVPENTPLEIKPADGGISFVVPRLLCHQMVELA